MKNVVLCFLLVPVLGLAGCDATTSTTGDATVRVHLTDFPFHLVEEANVTIERVELVRQGGPHEVLAEFDEPPLFNLIELQDGVTALLAEDQVPGGVYNQLRIVVGEDAQVVLVPDPDNPGEPPQVFDLTVPSGTETGIKINLPQLTIDTEGELVEIIVDFDVADSFVVQGNPESPSGINGFIFKPVLRLAYLEVNGEVIIE